LRARALRKKGLGFFGHVTGQASGSRSTVEQWANRRYRAKEKIVPNMIRLRMPSKRTNIQPPVLDVVFYQTTSGSEPVREWLKELPPHERQAIGEDIKAVQFRWPLGMPLLRKLTGKVWEVRTQLPTRIARVLFTVKGQHMVLLHGFIKKTQATPAQDIELAEKRIDF
jgi:phage-related protein